jgi:diguanylate cyclase (GGDEF)-like protein
MSRDVDLVDRDRHRRLRALEELGVLDRIGDPVLTALTRLACLITGASAAAVHVFDDVYQRRIAAVGLPLLDEPAEGSVCRRVVLTNTRIVVSNIAADARTAHLAGENGAGLTGFYASVPIRVDGGVAIGTICAFDQDRRDLTDAQLAGLEDLSELARAHLELVKVATELSHAATLDALTGAVNRVIFDDRLAQALARRKRNGGDLLVAVIDLDNFKAINDSHGHDCGDSALRWVADRLRANLRGEDTLGRLGGDEFGVVAEIATGGADAVTAHVQRAADGFEPAFTVSVGSVLAAETDSVETVLKRADRAMYDAKRAHASTKQ